MSNWLEPDCARAAIVTARPAIGTAAALEAAPDEDEVELVTAVDVVAAKAEKPRFGRPLASVFAVAVPFWAFAVPAADDDAVALSPGRALA